MLLILVIAVYPMIDSLVISLQIILSFQRGIRRARQLTSRVLGDPIFRGAIGTTLIFSL